MAGPHLDALIMECFLDAQGTEVWKGFYLGGEQWWVGWHTTTPFHNRNLDEPCDWFLIGYEKWCHNRQGHAYLAEAYYQEPNPSTSHLDADLTPVGQRYVAYNDHGQQTYAGYLGEPLMFPKGKGKKGIGKGKGKKGIDKGQGKGKYRSGWCYNGNYQMDSKGKGKADGKGSGSVQQDGNSQRSTSAGTIIYTF